MEELERRLRVRDARERAPFQRLVDTLDVFAAELEDSLVQQESLRAELKRTRLLNGSSGQVSNAFGAASSLGLVAELQKKLEKLREERAELYKLQGQQATQLLSLNDALRGKDSELAAAKAASVALSVTLKEKEMRLEEARQAVEEKNGAIQVIQDELIALQLELLKATEKTQISEDMEYAGLGSGSGSSAGPDSLQIKFEREIVAPHQFPLSSATSLAARHFLATGSEDQKIIVYDLTRISTRSVLKWSGMNGPIVALATSSDAQWLASCAAYDSEIVVWSLADGSVRCTLPFHEPTVGDSPSQRRLMLAFSDSPAGLRLWLATGHAVRLWDVGRSLLLRSWSLGSKAKGKNVDNAGTDSASASEDKAAVAIVPDQRPDRLWLLSGPNARLINGAHGRLEQELQLNIDLSGFGACACSWSRELIAFASGDRVVVLQMGLDAAASKRKFDPLYEVIASAHGMASPISAIALHPSRLDLAAIGHADGTLSLVSASLDNWTPRWTVFPSQQQSHTEAITFLCWGPESIDPVSGRPFSKLVSLSSEDRRLRLWTVTSAMT